MAKEGGSMHPTEANNASQLVLISDLYNPIMPLFRNKTLATGGDEQKQIQILSPFPITGLLTATVSSILILGGCREAENACLSRMHGPPWNLTSADRAWNNISTTETVFLLLRAQNNIPNAMAGISPHLSTRLPVLLHHIYNTSSPPHAYP